MAVRCPSRFPSPDGTGTPRTDLKEKAPSGNDAQGFQRNRITKEVNHVTTTTHATATAVATRNPQFRVSEIKNRMVARRGRGLRGQVLATASRSTGHDDDEWIGWLIEADGRDPIVVKNRTLARMILEEYAAEALTGTGRVA